MTSVPNDLPERGAGRHDRRRRGLLDDGGTSRRSRRQVVADDDRGRASSRPKTTSRSSVGNSVVSAPSCAVDRRGPGRRGRCCGRRRSRRARRGWRGRSEVARCGTGRRGSDRSPPRSAPARRSPGSSACTPGPRSACRARAPPGPVSADAFSSSEQRNLVLELPERAGGAGPRGRARRGCVVSARLVSLRISVSSIPHAENAPGKRGRGPRRSRAPGRGRPRASGRPRRTPRARSRAVRSPSRPSACGSPRPSWR